MSNKKMKSKVLWQDKSWFPLYYGFCPDEKSWHAEMKRLDVKEHVPYPEADGCVYEFTNSDKQTCAIVTINKKFDGDKKAVRDILFHESVHVWQIMTQVMGEENPSIEFEAYSIQAIASNILEAYDKSRGKGGKTKRAQNKKRQHMD